MVMAAPNNEQTSWLEQRRRARCMSRERKDNSQLRLLMCMSQVNTQKIQEYAKKFILFNPICN